MKYDHGILRRRGTEFWLKGDFGWKYATNILYISSVILRQIV